MTKFISVLLFIYLLIGCRAETKSDFSKAKFYTFRNISNGVNLEIYYEPNGVYRDNKYYYFITDNSFFKTFIGNCDDHERLTVVMESKDSLWLHFYSDEFNQKPTKSELFSITKMRKERVIDVPFRAKR